MFAAVGRSSETACFTKERSAAGGFVLPVAVWSVSADREELRVGQMLYGTRVPSGLIRRQELVVTYSGEPRHILR